MALTKVDISLMDNTGTTANKLLAYDGSGNLPAVDGSQLTNVATGITESTSDPTISTNPSGGVGTQWNNKTSGEVYICTDATAGANVWKNVGAGSGNVEPWSFGGTNFGYCSGAFAPPASPTYSKDWIQKFSFTSDANATDSGNLTIPVWGGAGISSRTHGYCCGGYYHNFTGYIDVIDKFSFSAGGNAVDVGNLTGVKAYTLATSDKSTYAYVHGGSSPELNIIERFSLTTDGNGVDVGDLTVARRWAAAASTQSYGYAAGGFGNINVIERYQMQASANGVDVGDLVSGTVIGDGCAGVTSDTHGYYIRNHSTNPSGQDIQKYALASSANAAAVGDSPGSARDAPSGTSSTTHGYIAGGQASATNAIEKFSLSSDGNSAAIANLVYGTESGAAGTEY